jgi:BCD family chlorophyll transporter-like MFS transporter
MSPPPLSWFQICRLGLVQAGLGAVVVLTTSTLNRIMVVELALPAMLPGALVALHHAIQILRPRLGHGSDGGGRRTPWIIGGMAVLSLGGLGAAAGTAWMSINTWAGVALAVLSFALIGIGVGACGTTLLVLLAKRVDERRRAAAATIVWVMMVVGFIVTTAIVGHLLDPYSPGRLVAVAAAVSAIALALTVIAIWTVEGPKIWSESSATSGGAASETPFVSALAQVWSEARSRYFAIFIFVSMLAYSAPELILEPFAGSVFAMTPGESTMLASIQHGGVLAGMTTVAVLSVSIGGRRFAGMRVWTIGGCIASALALINVAATGLVSASPLRSAVFVLGLANGIYAVAAIGSMMSLVSSGQKSREGVRMGLWDAAQATAFGLGGFIGTLASDVARLLIGSPSSAYAAVFAGESVLFLVSAFLASRVFADENVQAGGRFAGVVSHSLSDVARSRL